jgi:predicted glycosyltransferase involved in capsule biosynthesis
MISNEEFRKRILLPVMFKEGNTTKVMNDWEERSESHMIFVSFLLFKKKFKKQLTGNVSNDILILQTETFPILK